jgi:hypothetical protein
MAATLAIDDFFLRLSEGEEEGLLLLLPSMLTFLPTISVSFFIHFIDIGIPTFLCRKSAADRSPKSAADRPACCLLVASRLLAYLTFLLSRSLLLLITQKIVYSPILSTLILSTPILSTLGFSQRQMDGCW